MSATAEALAVTVPDIGDFGEVPVIEILVAVGDTVAPEDPLVTLESDKATMDVPSPAAGIVKAMHVKVGDSVSEGSLVLDLEPTAGDRAAPRPDEDESCRTSRGRPGEGERVAGGGGHASRCRGRCHSGPSGAIRAAPTAARLSDERRLTGLRESVGAEDRARARRRSARCRGQRPQGPPDA